MQAASRIGPHRQNLARLYPGQSFFFSEESARSLYRLRGTPLAWLRITKA
jgi:hypothetical protein